MKKDFEIMILKVMLVMAFAWATCGEISIVAQSAFMNEITIAFGIAFVLIGVALECAKFYAFYGEDSEEEEKD